jgi:hypothetical protein
LELTGRGSYGGKSLLRGALLLAAVFCCAHPLFAQKVHVYVGRIGTSSFLLAWGTAEGSGNTIGRNSVPLGSAVVEVAGRRVPSDRNWVEIINLSPDTEYSYSLRINGRIAGEGTVRTEPERASRLAFFVLGDYGTGGRAQYRIAEAMRKEWERRAQTDDPVRFVLTTGDNIYEERFLGLVTLQDGRRDRDWGPKVFEPYAVIRKSIPFYPSPGNHDVPAMQPGLNGEPGPYFDNFFFPSAEPAPYYTFTYGGLADFFSTDTTAIQEDRALGTIEIGSPQFVWLKQALAHSEAPWKIAYFHHAPFNAGPGHEADLPGLRHVVQLFAESGVDVAFSGHEHNFQFSKRDSATDGVLYVVSGAGGQLRGGNIRNNMEHAHIAGAASQHHFLLVEIEDRTMRITPLSWEPVRVEDATGHQIPMPIVVELPTESGDAAHCGNSRCSEETVPNAR